MTNIPKLIFAVSGDSRDEVISRWGSSVWHSLADNGFVERKTIGSVGFWRDILENRLIVVLPKALSGSRSGRLFEDPIWRRERIYSLLRTFRKVRADCASNLEGGATNVVLERKGPSADPVLDSFDAALKLRRDYRKNGLYLRKSRRPVVDADHLTVDWDRTMRRNSMVLNGDDVIFRGAVHHARKRDWSHPLTRLQISCLKEIFQFTGEHSDLDSSTGFDARGFSRVKSNPRPILRELRGRIFDERGRFLLNSIEAYLSEGSLLVTNVETYEELLCYSRDFEDIWERILRDLLAPDLGSRSLPPGRWHTWPMNQPDSGIKPEFDVRLASERFEALIDAKDYRVFSVSKWSGSSNDHYKQIIYRHLLEEARDRHVLNILAFPGIGQKELFSIRGCHYWKEIPDSLVFEVTVDYDIAVSCWLREMNLDVANQLEKLMNALHEFENKVVAAEPEPNLPLAIL